MKKVILQRYNEDLNQSLGTLTVLDEKGVMIFTCPCLERGDRNNKIAESNVLPGKYPLVLEWSPRFKQDLWELKDTAPRSEMKIHAANYWHQLHGCIAPGSYLKDLNNDGHMDVARSRSQLDAYHRAMGNSKKAVMIVRDPVTT